ncbi:hypothetical protein PoB_005697500 [Plakobranchus ocellatus]|uniref:Uncharacterized protein n=1 Tax=Plakobranchus ocellatus TaxID=259542 RepID=A0AAV4CFI5_9GAST|nr:hypothetical protein PoB_005697500 [Plakobranchus ocellatus]
MSSSFGVVTFNTDRLLSKKEKERVALPVLLCPSPSTSHTHSLTHTHTTETKLDLWLSGQIERECNTNSVASGSIIGQFLQVAAKTRTQICEGWRRSNCYRSLNSRDDCQGGRQMWWRPRGLSLSSRPEPCRGKAFRRRFESPHTPKTLGAMGLHRMVLYLVGHTRMKLVYQAAGLGQIFRVGYGCGMRIPPHHPMTHPHSPDRMAKEHCPISEADDCHHVLTSPKSAFANMTFSLKGDLKLLGLRSITCSVGSRLRIRTQQEPG